MSTQETAVEATQTASPPRLRIKQIKSAGGDGTGLIGQQVTVKGWVRTVRNQKTFSFIEVNDGSTLSNLQVICDKDMTGYQEAIDVLSTGCAVAIVGTVTESPGKNQAVEIKASEIIIVGTCDPETYPLQKKRHSFEFLRGIAHLRPRTNTIGAVTRVRNSLAYATHRFFQDQGFQYIHTPIITTSDCEGAGELFRVTTLDSESKSSDPADDFFGRSAYLTCSGQLNAEIYAMAMSDVYTFGPTFRAENSNTSRHLAEFWMIEPELAFADLHDDIDNAEAYIKYVVKAAMDECAEDIELFDKFIEKGLLQRLQQLVETPFERITYSEAVAILEKANKKWEFPVTWGHDLKSEHERYLAEEHFKKPIIVSDYPKGIKAFYMRLNDDNKTVAAMDILAPGIGEIVGGSQREERLDVLTRRMKENDLDPEVYWWYLELRKYGGTPHAGYGVGFERLVQFVTGMENIRDVIPFPRVPGHADF